MAIAETLENGHDYRNYNVATNVESGTALFESNTGTATDTHYFPDNVMLGVWGGPLRRFHAVFKIGPIDVPRLDNLSEFTLSLPVVRCYKWTQFEIRAYANPTAPAPSSSYLPSDQVLTNAVIYDNTAQWEGVSQTTDWPPTTPIRTYDIRAIAQEVVNHANWTANLGITIVVKFIYNPSINGYVRFYNMVSTAGDAPSVSYSANPLPSITTVSGDDVIEAGELNIIIAGSNFTGATALRIFKNTSESIQTIKTITATQITFDYSGGLALGTGYTLELSVGTLKATKTIEITEAPPATGTVVSGQVLTAIDGHEYGASFPGTWESMTSTSSIGATNYFLIQYLVGVWGSPLYKFKASIRIGAINVNKGDIVTKADLILPVINCYKGVDLRIKAIADPAAAAIGVGNVITGKTLTTAQVSQSNLSWAGYSGTDNWTPTVNPQSISVISIMQEVINHSNWTYGGFITFILDYADLAGVQGRMQLRANESTAGAAASLDYAVDVGITITSVSGDSKIEMGEVDCTIIGTNLNLVTTVSLSKGGTSVSQTIKSKTYSRLIFDVTNGALTPATGHTITLSDGTKNATATFELILGGGVNTGTLDTNADGMESGAASLPVTGTFYETTSQNSNTSIFSNNILVGVWGSPLQYHTVTMRFSGINALKNQAITSANLVLNCAGAYKWNALVIKAVKDPAVAELGTGLLPSSQTLTTASATSNTSTWTGNSGTATWSPGTKSISVTSVLAEVVSHANWTYGGAIQFVITFTIIGGVDGYVRMYADEHATAASTFEYVTGAATSISSVNGDNILRTGDLDVELLGLDFASATNLRINDGTWTEVQTIKSNSGSVMVFDFYRGKLGHGAATITFTSLGIDYSANITLRPAADRLYTVIATPNTADNSIFYEALYTPAAGDIIEHQAVSAQGFGVQFSASGVPSIIGGNDDDSFLAYAYDKSVGTWYEAQTVLFKRNSYFLRHQVPTLAATSNVVTGGAEITTSDSMESWRFTNEEDDTEIWTFEE